MAITSTSSEARQIQMNTRIDARLKEAGDAVLTRLGYTPSAAVRGFWRFVVEHQDDAAAICEVIAPDAASMLSDAVDRRLSATAELRDLYAQTANELRIAEATPADLPSWDNLREAWYDERLDREA